MQMTQTTGVCACILALVSSCTNPDSTLANGEAPIPLVAPPSSGAAPAVSVDPGTCGMGRVSAYYTPAEVDFSRDAVVTVLAQDTGGQDRQFVISQGFSSAIQDMGMGRLKEGPTLGYWDHRFWLVEDPLDAEGNRLNAGTVSVSRNGSIPHGSDVQIAWTGDRVQWYRGADTNDDPAGGGFDVTLYTGEGGGAKAEADAINDRFGAEYAICYHE